jgi:hypothetical protein
MTTVFVDPQSIHNPAAGSKPPASWGDTVRDGLVALAAPPGCVVSRTAVQSFASGTEAALTFTATDTRDTDAFHTASSATVTVPTGFGGLYLVTAKTLFGAHATGYRMQRLTLNASEVTRDTTASISGSTSTGMTTSLTVVLAAGDDLQLLLYQNSGSALDCTGALALTLLGWS